MARTAVLGFPRIGAGRELKFALEAYWAGRTSAQSLQQTAHGVRATAWRRARERGIDVIPSGDFSLYDHVLDTAWGLGAIPERFGGPDADGLDAYFALARGSTAAAPLEMTKWFDTNYHYLVPELVPGQRFRARPEHWVRQFREAAALGIVTRPVLLGPISFLVLAKGLRSPLDALDALVPAYADLLRAVTAAGATEVQVDEPCLALDRDARELDAFSEAWRELAGATPAELCLTTYFAGLRPGGALERAVDAAPAELHLDLVRAPDQLGPILSLLRDRPGRLSLGVLDGRNVWATDPDAALRHVDRALAELGEERVTIAPSCSLLHLPYRAGRETGIDPEVRPWLAFASERLDELARLRDAALATPERRDALLAPARAVVASRRASARTYDEGIRRRVAGIAPGDYARRSPAEVRRAAQHARTPLPELPTTTIGSFPQTEEIRTARRQLRDGDIGADAYATFMEAQIAEVVAVQEQLGLDVLVHGEPERNDMVEYFGEQLEGFALSRHGWVQSYGSRCVKPPILYGDVARRRPMTVRWWQHAQSLTDRPVKAMLTGPVTILQWSFVRDDLRARDTSLQVAIAISDEVADLERAGAFAVQVDEAALREGLPLRAEDRDDYLRWAIDAFRLTTAAVGDETQVHTHMCYSDFNDMLGHIARLDADVLSIEASRSDMEVLDAFSSGASYPNDIGPGVYDIHSSRIPSAAEMEHRLELAEQRIGRRRLWVNPDCGLKTRRWEEVRPALEHMVRAAHARRAVSRPD